MRFALILLLAGALPAYAANISGKWTIQGSTGRGGGRGPQTVLLLNQVGNEVTGTVTPRTDPGTASPVNNEIFAGKVDGNVISFYVWTGTDQPVKTQYRGTISADGEEIQFTLTGGPATSPPRGPSAASQPVTAKRAK